MRGWRSPLGPTNQSVHSQNNTLFNNPKICSFGSKSCKMSGKAKIGSLFSESVWLCVSMWTCLCLQVLTLSSHFRPTLLNMGSLLILTMLKPELNIPGI